MGRNRTRWAFMLALAIALGTQASLAAPEFAEGRILVQPRAGLSDAQFQKILRQNGASTRRRVTQIDLHVVNVPPRAEDKVVAALSRNPHVVFAEKDVLLELSAVTPDDPYYSNAWHLPKMGLPSAWERTRGNGVIAVLDTGVDSAHPDLSGQLVSGVNAVDAFGDTSDIHGHGTKVAGVIAALSNNASGVASIAWDSKVMPVRVTNSSDGWAHFSDIANGLVWAADHGARVANISYDVTGSASVNSAAQYMRNKGGLVVVAAGNSGTDPGHADSPYIISVSATGSSDSKTSWSSYGRYVDVAAPGAGIWTTTRGGGYGSVSGTSFASPATAAVVALIRATNSTLAVVDVEEVLKASAVDLGSAGRDSYYGYGRVDAAAAVQLADQSTSVDTQPPAVQIASPGNGATVDGLVPVDVRASDVSGVSTVELYAGDSLVGRDIDAPYAFTWDSSRHADGDVRLIAYAVDTKGNRGEAEPVTVQVANGSASDTSPPEVTIVAPGSGSTVDGNVTVSARAADDSPVSQLVLYAGGKMLCAVDGASASCNWNTRKLSGSQTVSATATDAAGNQGSASIQVTVAASSGGGKGGGKGGGSNNGKGGGKNK